ncbi:MAG TPA: VOC family protein [Verrucomicrobiae bacterium]|nr:VOC family protein [Verrucomicrobiae bacterium]
MERVTGIGGVFFKAQNPEALATWYRSHLGMCAGGDHTDFEWREKDNPNQIGRTVWSLFRADTDSFGPGSKPFMINYRVANLERMLNQLRSQGVTVEKIEDYDYGRFAWITDPEGNRIELWEPKGSQ